MYREPIRLNESGKLRIQFIDANQEPIQADNVYVDIFNPGLDPNVDTPSQSNLIPTYLGNGIFELAFTPSSTGGIYIDKWYGEILGTPTIGLLNFQVISSGSITNYSSAGLIENSLVTIFLSKEIASLTGINLSEDIEIVFTTLYNPLYSSVRKVRLEAGGLLVTVPDDTINLAILEASLEADILSFRVHAINTAMFEHARRQYVTCLAAYMLISNVLVSGGIKKSKKLSDFEVEYDHSMIPAMLDKLNNCLAKWTAQVQTGGGARATQSSRMVVKGELDPDRPAVGRLWRPVGAGQLPIGNGKNRYWGSRRHKTDVFWRGKGPSGSADW